MNTTNTTTFRNASEAQARNPAPVSQARREYRERDFGVGYGNSSGYALAKRYTSDWGQPRFRCA